MKRVLFSAVSTVALAMAAPALAQQAPAATELGEIVVTGEKIDRTLQETTTSVAVATAVRIENEGVLSLQEIYDRTANLTQTYGSDGVSIRGVMDTGVAGAGDAPLATVYVDGAPLPNGIMFNGPTDSWDVAQVEILRGPQSTLQGLNALAGSVVIRTEDPSDTWDLKARLTLADPEETGFAIAGGGPLVEGELAFRIAAESREGDGYVWNVTRNEPEAPVDRQTVRGKLLWTPSAVPGLEARLGYTHFESSGGYPFVYSRTDVPDFYDDRIAVNDSRNGSDIGADIVTLEISYPLNDSLSLTSATSWSDVSDFTEYDNDGSAANLGYGFSDRQYETLTQEFRLGYQGAALRGVLGAFYYNRGRRVRDRACPRPRARRAERPPARRAAGSGIRTTPRAASGPGRRPDRPPPRRPAPRLPVTPRRRSQFRQRLSGLAGARPGATGPGKTLSGGGRDPSSAGRPVYPCRHRRQPGSDTERLREA